MNTITDKNNTIITNTIKDPHHEGFNEYGLYNGEFYIRHLNIKTWTRMNKLHLTIPRVKALNSLIQKRKQNEKEL